MGGDFTFQDANAYFKNLDKLIRCAQWRRRIKKSETTISFKGMHVKKGVVLTNNSFFVLG